MAKLEATVVITRPVDEVFAFFLALDQHAATIEPTVEAVLKTPEGPVQAGTMLRIQQRRNGKLNEVVARVTTVEPLQKISFEVEAGGVRPRCEIVFAPRDRETQVTIRVDPASLGKLRFLGGVIERKAQQELAPRIEKVKQLLESGSSAPSPAVGAELP
jgi:uncharacterized protein YndB with AHSA1/START domain